MDERARWLYQEILKAIAPNDDEKGDGDEVR